LRGHDLAQRKTPFNPDPARAVRQGAAREPTRAAARRIPRPAIRRLIGGIAIAAAGAACAEPPDLGAPGWQFQVDNDYFAPVSATDRWYTNGLRLTHIFEPGQGPGFLEKPADPLGGWACSGCQTTVGLYLGQEMYTPNQITVATPQPQDRPWAGWLYGGAVAAYSERLERSGFHERQQSFALTVGIIGPGAGADVAQTEWHEFVGAPKPLGWSNQLKNEPTLQVGYVSKWRLVGPQRTWDVIPHLGASLGSPHTLARAGLTVRLGDNMCGFGAGRLPLRKTDGAEPPEPDPSIAPSCDEAATEWYVFAGGEARAVAWNTFLDGGVFRAGPSVDKEPFVLDATVGVSLRLWKHLRLTYSYTVRTREFKPTPQGAPAAHGFGSVVVAYEYR
jgi:hypothetical protein